MTDLALRSHAPEQLKNARWSPDGPLSRTSAVELLVGGQAPLMFTWGRHDAFGTPAYWVDQARRGPRHWTATPSESLIDEVCFCLLGGFGITAEMNIAAFSALADAELIRTDPPPTEQQIVEVLMEPLRVRGRDRLIRYRFPNQRASRISEALARLRGRPLPIEPRALRDALLAAPGVGPKTASWIVRNHTGSNDVAIIDVHLRRAGIAAGFFRAEWRLPSQYHLFESAFLAYADVGGVAAGVLDLCIWEQVRRLGQDAGAILGPVGSRGVEKGTNDRR